MDLLCGVNDCQKEAILHKDGPALVLAGAGAGKTAVIVRRIAYLVSCGVAPHQILAVTFTNKAAREMKERTAKIVGPRAKQVYLSTFHAFCARLLRAEHKALETHSAEFTIYPSEDSEALVKDCLRDLDIDDKMFKPSAVRATISSFKNALMEAPEAADYAGTIYLKTVARVYVLYQERLEKSNAMDFDDLLLYTVKLLRRSPEVLARMQTRFSYVLIDEYQDTNKAQYVLTRLLTARHRNLFAVGDIDQSIYGFRDADISNILNFERDFPEAKVVKLEQNYRSTKTILEAANGVIEKNKNRRPKTLWTENDKGDPIYQYSACDDHQEAEFVANAIDNCVSVGYRPNDIVVLYRTNAQSRVIEEHFLRRGRQYLLVGGLRFYERKEIKDMLAYLKTLANPADDLSFSRIINVPRRGIGDKTEDIIRDLARAGGEPLSVAVTSGLWRGRVPRRAEESLGGLAHLLCRLRGEAASAPVDEVILKVFIESGLKRELEEESEKKKTSIEQARIENVYELVRIAREFAARTDKENTVGGFLEHVALISDIDNLDDEANDRVTLMTIHAAKGLEFPVVFLVGFEEGVFPHRLCLDSERDIEEERRLCYVALTRAKRVLFITNTAQRMINGEVSSFGESRFLREIPEHLVQKV